MELALQDGLSYILKIAKDKPILIEVRGGKLFLGTYTDHHKIVYESPVKSENSRIILSHEVAKELPSLLPGEVLIEDEKLIVKNKGNKTTITALSDTISLSGLARGYQKENQATFSGREFKEAFTYTKHASNDKNIGDTIMRGYHLSVCNSHAEVMASNGAMLSVSRVNQTNPDFELDDTLLLNSDFHNAVKLIEDSELKLGYTDSSVSLTSEGENHTLRIISSLLTGKPLPYQQVVENAKKPGTMAYIVDRKSFFESVKQVKVFSENSALISLYNTGEFEISSQNKLGIAKREVSVKSFENKEDTNLEIKINIDYLFSYLATNRSEFIKLHALDETSPLFFEDSIGIEVLAPLRK